MDETAMHAEATRLRSDDLEAEVSPLGAELVALRDAQGRDFLWDGDPAYWKGRAPLLFPIVGKVPNDQLLIAGKAYPMRQHGLARVSRFDLVARDEGSCLFRLDATDASRDIYPFAFRLDVRYALAGARLAVEATVANRGEGAMPCSFGFHPAFRWPLPGGGTKARHEVVFAEAEDAPARRLDGGLLRTAPDATPIAGRRLALSESLFDDDVLILDELRSRELVYRSPDGPSVRMRFPAMPHLGLWSKPGAGFLCIEPWQGYAAPAGFSGELAAKPGTVSIEPGGARTFAMSLEIGG